MMSQHDAAEVTDGAQVHTLRGHPIYLDKGVWRYVDTDEPTVETWRSRPCGHCGQMETADGHDACLGELPGVENACCGHGDPSAAYVQYKGPMSDG
jgi:hypothetical protein